MFDCRKKQGDAETKKNDKKKTQSVKLKKASNDSRSSSMWIWMGLAGVAVAVLVGIMFEGDTNLLLKLIKGEVNELVPTGSESAANFSAAMHPTRNFMA